MPKPTGSVYSLANLTIIFESKQALTLNKHIAFHIAFDVYFAMLFLGLQIFYQ